MNIVACTYRIRVGQETGTMFAVDFRGHQYLITARHIAKEAKEACEIEWEQGWQPLRVRLVGHCTGEVDISVLSIQERLPQMLLPEWESPIFEPDLKLGEAIRFYGFPYGLSTSRGSGTVPVPLVKSGIVSGFHGDAGLGPDSSFLIDGHNNPGFSGGPLVSIRDNAYKIAGVISAYLQHEEDVLPLSPDRTRTPMGRVMQNSGILVAWNIQHAIDVMVGNPIGLPVQ